MRKREEWLKFCERQIKKADPGALAKWGNLLVQYFRDRRITREECARLGQVWLDRLKSLGLDAPELPRPGAGPPLPGPVTR